MTISADLQQRLDAGLASHGAGAEAAAILNGTTVQAFTGANTHSGAETHSGIETHSGAETHAGAETHSGAEVFTGGFTVTTTGITITDVNITLSSTTGTKFGATGDKLGFLGATPIVQRVGSAQTAVVGTGATNSTPYGYSQSQADAIVTLVNELRAALVAFGIIKGAA